MPDYREIYLHNVYEVELNDGSTFSFSLTDFPDNIFFDQPFAILTAHNPMNRLLCNQENTTLNKKLYSELYKRYPLLAAKGCYKTHCESGYLVYGISLSEALKIARNYEQYAIFYNSTRELSYVESENNKVIVSRKR